jgi:hypothetical protein
MLAALVLAISEKNRQMIVLNLESDIQGDPEFQRHFLFGISQE